MSTESQPPHPLPTCIVDLIHERNEARAQQAAAEAQLRAVMQGMDRLVEMACALWRDYQALAELSGAELGAAHRHQELCGQLEEKKADGRRLSPEPSRARPLICPSNAQEDHHHVTVTSPEI